MNKEKSKAIEEFFKCVEHLKSLRIIRSDKYLGDIAEFICKSEFGVELAPSGRQPGHDGHIGNSRVQIKYSGGVSTTVECGDPDSYEELIVVIGPGSVLRTDANPNGFVLYRIPSASVKQKEPHKDKKRRYTKRQLPAECLVQAKK